MHIEYTYQLRTSVTKAVTSDNSSTSMLQQPAKMSCPYAALAWDLRSCHLLSMTLGRHLRVWALPTSDQAPLPSSVNAQSRILQLQLVVSTTLGPEKSLATPVLRGATAMLHWHIRSAAFQVWLQTEGLDILCALQHPLVGADSGSLSRLASAPPTASDAVSTSQTHCYKGHQVGPSFQQQYEQRTV